MALELHMQREKCCFCTNRVEISLRDAYFFFTFSFIALQDVLQQRGWQRHSTRKRTHQDDATMGAIPYHRRMSG